MEVLKPARAGVGVARAQELKVESPQAQGGSQVPDRGPCREAPQRSQVIA